MNESPLPLPIGLFARLSGLSPSALRYYDEIGLLPPHAVDPASRYRSYAAEQLGVGRGLALLRAMDCPLAELRRYVEAAATGQQAAFLGAFRGALLARAHRAQEDAAAVEQFMRSLEDTVYDITVTEQPATSALTVTRRATPRADVGRAVVEGFNGHLWPFVQAHAHPVQEPALFICRDEDDGVAEVVVAVPSAVAGAGGCVNFETVPGGRFLQTVHAGPYETMGAAYEALLAYAGAHGLSVLPETREVYLMDYRTTDDETALRTRVQCRIR